MIYIAQVSVDSFKNDLVDSAREGLEWGSSVGVALTASLLAIALVKFLFYR